MKQICVVKQPVGDVKKQLGQDVASISKWYLEAYQRINDVIVKNQILVASFIGYLGDKISILEICRQPTNNTKGVPPQHRTGVYFLLNMNAIRNGFRTSVLSTDLSINVSCI